MVSTMTSNLIGLLLPKLLTVSLDGNEIISYNKDIVADIFSGNNEVYYGFTAATGMATNLQMFG